jgi:hypothetical protein
MGAFLSLIPIKDWFYGALIVGFGVLCWHYHEKYINAVNYAQTVKAESAQTKKDADQRIADLTKDYDKGLAANKVIYETELADASKQHAVDADRLRALAATRGKDPVLSGTDGLAAAIAGWSYRVSRVEHISDDLAVALRLDDAAATECWRDRDALTGK